MSLERVVLDVFRLAVKGDDASARRYGKKLLQDPTLQPELREGLAKLLAAAPASPLRWAQSEPASQAESFIVALPPNPTEEAPLLAQDVQGAVDQLVDERERQHELEAIGLIPTRTVLLTGPPGVGKTLTARHIANRMGLPLLRVDLSGLMSSYLGKTGQNLRAMLVSARESPSVLLLDEFDAIAKRRDDPADVGELKRIVNVLLLELDDWPSTSLLIAATNHPELLDRAIWRRFEKTIPIGPPAPPVRRQLLEREVARYAKAVSPKTLEAVVAATDGASSSDVVTLVRGTARRAVLHAETPFERVLVEAALDRLLGVMDDDSHARGLYCRVAHEHLGASQREIAARLGVSHVAVGKTLRAMGHRGEGAVTRTRASED